MEFREIPIETLSKLKQGFDEVSVDLNDRVIPKQEADAVYWDYIRVEIWEGSGRIIFFPASSKTKLRVDTLGNYIVCKELVEKVASFDESELPDEEYENMFDQIIECIALDVLNYFSKEKTFIVRCFDQDDKEFRT